jgi:hypothetical protein
MWTVFMLPSSYAIAGQSAISLWENRGVVGFNGIAKSVKSGRCRLNQQMHLLI